MNLRAKNTALLKIICTMCDIIGRNFNKSFHLIVNFFLEFLNNIWNDS